MTFGIKPETASTGYGYIEKGGQIDGTSCFEVSRFAEKPENQSLSLITRWRLFLE